MREAQVWSVCKSEGSSAPRWPDLTAREGPRHVWRSAVSEDLRASGSTQNKNQQTQHGIVSHQTVSFTPPGAVVCSLRAQVWNMNHERAGRASDTIYGHKGKPGGTLVVLITHKGCVAIRNQEKKLPDRRELALVSHAEGLLGWCKAQKSPNASGRNSWSHPGDSVDLTPLKNPSRFYGNLINWCIKDALNVSPHLQLN